MTFWGSRATPDLEYPAPYLAGISEKVLYVSHPVDRAAELARLTDARLILTWHSSSKGLSDPIAHLIAREMIRRGLPM